MHWMALINKQPEIDSITQALSHLLSYNLDKDNVSTNLERELSALPGICPASEGALRFPF